MNTSLMRRLSVMLVPAILCCVSVALAQQGDEDYWAALKNAYKYDEWAGKTKTEYKSRASHSDVPIHMLRPTAEVVITADGKIGYGNVPNYGYLLLQKDGAKVRELTIRMAEGQNASDAHRAMMQFMAESSAPPFRPASQVGVDLGDAAFVGWGQAVSGVKFCRNNIFVCCGSNDPAMSVVEIATKIDVSLLRASLAESVLVIADVDDSSAVASEAVSEDSSTLAVSAQVLDDIKTLTLYELDELRRNPTRITATNDRDIMGRVLWLGLLLSQQPEKECRYTKRLSKSLVTMRDIEPALGEEGHLSPQIRIRLASALVASRLFPDHSPQWLQEAYQNSSSPIIRARLEMLMPAKVELFQRDVSAEIREEVAKRKAAMENDAQEKLKRASAAIERCLGIAAGKPAEELPPRPVAEKPSESPAVTLYPEHSGEEILWSTRRVDLEEYARGAAGITVSELTDAIKGVGAYSVLLAPEDRDRLCNLLIDLLSLDSGKLNDLWPRRGIAADLFIHEALRTELIDMPPDCAALDRLPAVESLLAEGKDNNPTLELDIVPVKLARMSRQLFVGAAQVENTKEDPSHK